MRADKMAPPFGEAIHQPLAAHRAKCGDDRRDVAKTTAPLAAAELLGDGQPEDLLRREVVSLTAARSEAASRFNDPARNPVAESLRLNLGECRCFVYRDHHDSDHPQVNWTMGV
jgi:hypothetical protein